ncbi:MAG: hypothetical protein A2836_00520 [Candidatus Taylorbacteria bacterium RIFCSPHIGHO2_01_FULL_45_63]|uniref:PD-(D/E)XK endonuclease-like domain-containing protein n=1 Tax=Candidatus Taylorbacteria bacterium RIFCSPHIGHO2_02_FULL_45_35 TaxID=1802311 RepID=A0A1G2MPB4_9BACT|nr:MAG: hypothetical protein A2836_00520 [Candidatus Taylorbacteria bacterium RIFCSPHIGHO2_01_FULL_45_63]OHA25740.1 MAG: hypothetical protein A3D56_03240 [Candidatus Taylorbacteria bacterium RIFCSPHIGHO2_02_FULL_45_35]OHA34820.1 MAG: hypothetical protein A3A22_00310 [Candidatus Taylorbacteria bacterium RIFCSPLOWO2_01_FULL_45_34b]
MDFSYKRKTFGLFKPDDTMPFKISRSKIDLFIECPRCFYLDQRLGIRRPAGFPFTLNSAVDLLLKKEFDIHRAAKTAHPLMKKYKLDAVPFDHPKIEEWRDALRRGISYLHTPTNMLVRGGIDDIWVNPAGEVIIVDYKATAKDGEITLDEEWKDGYKRQMEVYQWLFRQNNFKVSPTGYFVYVNGKTDRKAFDGKLEFDVTLLPYTGDDSWIPKILPTIKACLVDVRVPSAKENCDYCAYTKLIEEDAPQARKAKKDGVSSKETSLKSKKNEKTETLFS